MIGLAAATLKAEDIKEIQAAVENDSNLELSLDLMSKKVRCGKKMYDISIPESRRQALIEGTWDNTSLLLGRLDKAKTTAASLPYMNNFNS